MSVMGMSAYSYYDLSDWRDWLRWMRQVDLTPSLVFRRHRPRRTWKPKNLKWSGGGRPVSSPDGFPSGFV